MSMRLRDEDMTAFKHVQNSIGILIVRYEQNLLLCMYSYFNKLGLYFVDNINLSYNIHYKEHF